MDEPTQRVLGNPMVMFFWNFGMLLVGIVIREYWHSARMLAMSIAIVAGIFTLIHELRCCFMWSSLSAWRLGQRMWRTQGRLLTVSAPEAAESRHRMSWQRRPLHPQLGGPECKWPDKKKVG